MTAATVSFSSTDHHVRVVRALTAAALLAAAAGFIPAQLDLPHRVLHTASLMAPTCGLTRASLALLRLDIKAAASYNPAVFPLAALTAAVALREVIGRLTGTWVTVMRVPRWTRWAAAIALAGLAVWQQLRFEELLRA